jgi:drug/metabolite transporter (DMT)-like permease
MKTLGLVLIIIGIAMILVKGFSVTTEKKVVDLGPIEVNKKENKWIGWPTYAGAVIAVAGVVLVFTDRKKAG